MAEQFGPAIRREPLAEIGALKHIRDRRTYGDSGCYDFALQVGQHGLSGGVILIQREPAAVALSVCTDRYLFLKLYRTHVEGSRRVKRLREMVKSETSRTSLLPNSQAEIARSRRSRFCVLNLGVVAVPLSQIIVHNRTVWDAAGVFADELLMPKSDDGGMFAASLLIFDGYECCGQKLRMPEPIGHTYMNRSASPALRVTVARNQNWK